MRTLLAVTLTGAALSALLLLGCATTKTADPPPTTPVAQPERTAAQTLLLIAEDVKKYGGEVVDVAKQCGPDLLDAIKAAVVGGPVGWLTAALDAGKGGYCIYQAVEALLHAPKGAAELPLDPAVLSRINVLVDTVHGKLAVKAMRFAP